MFCTDFNFFITFLLSMVLSSYLFIKSQQLAPHIRLTYIYQYYIGSNLHNLNPWNTIFVIPAKYSHIFSRSRHDNRTDFTADRVKLQIPHMPYEPALLHAHNLFSHKSRKRIKQTSLGLSYAFLFDFVLIKAFYS